MHHVCPIREGAHERNGEPVARGLAQSCLVFDVVCQMAQGIALRGATIREGRGTVLSSTDLRAHNSFEQPDALVPHDAPVRRSAAGSLVHTFPPASVTRLQLTLA